MHSSITAHVVGDYLIDEATQTWGPNLEMFKWRLGNPDVKDRCVAGALPRRRCCFCSRVQAAGVLAPPPVPAAAAASCPSPLRRRPLPTAACTRA